MDLVPLVKKNKGDISCQVLMFKVDMLFMIWLFVMFLQAPYQSKSIMRE